VPSPDEGALIEAAREGSAAAFAELVRRYDTGVLRLALGMVKSEQDARDIYQETFLKAFRSIRGFRQECAFGTWLFRIATNLCLDHARRNGQLRDEPLVRPAGAGAAGRNAGEGRAAGWLVDRSVEGNPMRALEAGELRRLIGQALATLPPRERLVFGLRHGEGLRLAAIAEILQTSEETARNCLYRAHQRLRQMLGHLRGQAGVVASGRVAGEGVAGGLSSRGARLPGKTEIVGGVE
jgi:RNA polymerase sigma-70 factor (ECF subfamily)